MLSNILETIGSAILGLAMLFAGALGYSPETRYVDSLGATIPTVVANFETTLQSTITSSQTTMTLVSGTDASGDSLSGYMCFTIDEGTSKQEHVCGTVSGTSVTGMIRGIDPVDGDTEVASLKQSHRRGASVTLTNYPVLGVLARIMNGDETFPNVISYATSTSACSANDDICDKEYIDGVANAGAADANATTKGIWEAATTAELNAGTATGSTGALLAFDPATLAASIYGLYLPSSGQKDALAGSSGTPGSANTYITEDDVATGTTASKVVRRGTSGEIFVPTTPSTSSEAASKSYVDANTSKMLFTIDSISPTNNTSENTIFSATVTASTLGSTGGIFIKIPFTTGTPDGTASTYTYRLKLGGSTIATSTMVSPNIGGGSGGPGLGYLEAKILADGSTSAQDVYLGGMVSPFGVLAANKLFPYFSSVDTATSSVDMTSDQLLTITQQKSAATTNGSETYELGSVILMND